MDAIETLSRIFERFPGIGPRQAQRFVQYLLRMNPSLRRDLAEAVKELAHSVQQCPMCKRYHSGDQATCSIDRDEARDLSLLAVVSNDADLLALEKSGTYRGLYFVLGGLVSLVSDSTHDIRLNELLKSIPDRRTRGLFEVILALPANPEGDATATRVREALKEADPSVQVSLLGRGLSTGSELEYADPETLRNAMNGRKAV